MNASVGMQILSANLFSSCRFLLTLKFLLIQDLHRSEDVARFM
jgi:hypothetical protein